MPELGRYALCLAGGSAFYTVGIGAWNYRAQSTRLKESMRGAAVAIALALTFAVLVLEYLLVAGDYQVQAVYNHTDRALPLLFKMGALWGGDAGSVLFWGWILSLYTAFAAWRSWPRENRMTPLAVPILAGLLVFFTGMSNLVVNPFRLVVGNPVNGVGLDPLLQNLVMTIHPPAMYIGLIGMAVPAAYLMAALWTRMPSVEWVPVIRRWMLFSWMFLSAAIILGGMWAYMELGWGGYWEWDPVENASLMPWLAATAFLHALQIEERRGMFRWWTALLGISSFLLTLVGTYITRSGVLKNSVHSFTGTGVGPYFVWLFWTAAAGAFIVLVLRRDQLRDKMALTTAFSKEGIYLLINMLFASLAAIVLVGTFYPVISKAVLGATVVLTVHFFNSLSVPIFLVLVLMLGAAPVVGWRAARLRQVVRRLRVPWAAGLAACVLAYTQGFHTVLQCGAVGVSVFAAASMVQEFYRAARARRRSGTPGWLLALYETVNNNRRRYGGYTAHLAFLIIVLGVVGSHTNNLAVTRTLRPGQQIAMRGYRMVYRGLGTKSQGGYQLLDARLDVERGGRVVQEDPGLEFFRGSAQPVAAVAIDGGVMEDLYLVLEGTPGHQAATVQIFLNPMVSWIWIGMYVLVAGTLLAMGAPPHGDAALVRAWEFTGEDGQRRGRSILAAVPGRSGHD